MGQRENLEEFDEWLQNREEYDFIVDAANVAYFNQNFESGRFNYQQVEALVTDLER